MSIFWICTICLFIKVVSIVVLKATYTAIGDESVLEMILGLGCLLALVAVTIFSILMRFFLSITR